MTTIELLNLLSEYAKQYAPEAWDSLIRNNHMNQLRANGSENPSQMQVEAVLVDFINFIGGKCGIDYGMYTEDLKKER